ncbi:MAG: hypothetical protein KJ731_11770 [Alphaproteobacteria bacterium]|nr:hypothetical protein [Alphaproteobacteria bacterium]MBU1575564.1 hypothetical protein [Alphaproteobacteria bacterium]MBU1829133.1 hypothetical protein [Alphaproteobacteria bacterium]MBU2077650.1 hypothetical protein [Alphaproteobacteria bacterium]MBU2159420.1 hypothetical protein [Alphaproteobacteria bacterium]
MTWIYYDTNTAAWQHVRIGTGETSQFEEAGFKGSGDLDAGRIDGVPMSCVAAIEPFHGNTVAIYTRDPESDPATARWSRQVLDVYGDPNENGEGPGHQILCGDHGRGRGACITKWSIKSRCFRQIACLR